MMVVACIPPREHLLLADSMYSAGVGKRGGGGRGSMGGPCNQETVIRIQQLMVGGPQWEVPIIMIS